MTGPEHYKAAEEALEASQRISEKAVEVPPNQVTGYQFAIEMLVKRAHVHAMLAVASATANAGSNERDGIIHGYGESL